MAARGLLANPALFAGYECTPLKCVWDWVDIALEHGTPACFHRHLMYMLERITSQPERIWLLIQGAGGLFYWQASSRPRYASQEVAQRTTCCANAPWPQ
ncbi:hypothetical protein SRHO_G00006610 [Serrasalmus rhombeus]